MLKYKCLKALNILRFVSSIDWGADSTVLLNVCRSLILSKLDNECIVYRSVVRPISSCLRQFIIKDYDSHLERSEHLQLRVCMLKQTSLPLTTDVSNLVCSMQPS